MKVMSVFGTRPEAIKMAPVIRALAQETTLQSIVCVTAQHREMLDQALSLFDICPQYDLDVMLPEQSLNQLTSTILTKLQPVLSQERPDLLLVHGDTTTTMAGALAAYYSKIPVAHVEAGLRTRNIYAPWPEEINRRMVGAIASLHFAPTEAARKNLEAENVNAESISVTGNTVVDALELTLKKLHQNPMLTNDIDLKLGLDSSKRMILVTAHRREIFGDGIDRICNAIMQLASRPDVYIVFPVHLNTNIKVPVEKALGKLTNVKLIPPQDYLQFVRLMERSDIILTDSGGVQEEAPSLGKPVLVMRETTERPEAVDAGTVRLVGTSVDRIVSETRKLLDVKEVYENMACKQNPYGDGQAAGRIVKSVKSFLTSVATKL